MNKSVEMESKELMKENEIKGIGTLKQFYKKDLSQKKRNPNIHLSLGMSLFEESSR